MRMDPQRSAARARQFFEDYTKDLTASDLQRLFTDSGRSICEWIREQRLLMCDEELRKKNAQLTISEVAYNWGFADGKMCELTESFDTELVTAALQLPRQ